MENWLGLGLADLLMLETNQGQQGTEADSSGVMQSDLQSDQSLGCYVENRLEGTPRPDTTVDRTGVEGRQWVERLAWSQAHEGQTSWAWAPSCCFEVWCPLLANAGRLPPKSPLHTEALHKVTPGWGWKGIISMFPLTR